MSAVVQFPAKPPSFTRDELLHLLSMLTQQQILLRTVDEYGNRMTNYECMVKVTALLSHYANGDRP